MKNVKKKKDSTKNVREELMKHLFFNQLNKQQLKELMPHIERAYYTKGDIICEQEKHPEYVHYLVSGLVKMFIEGPFVKTQILSVVPPSRIIGLYSVFGNKPNSFFASALNDVEILMIEREFFQDFLERNPAQMRDFLNYFSDIEGKFLTQLVKFNQKNIKGKVAYVLKYFYEEVFRTDRFYLPISRKEFAELAGMSTENVIRTLSEFNKEKILKIRNRDVEILDHGFLNKVASYG